MKLVEGRDLFTRVRKAYRLQTIVGAILFSSHKYRSNADMLRSLDGHSCDFQGAPQMIEIMYTFESHNFPIQYRQIAW